METKNTKVGIQTTTSNVSFPRAGKQNRNSSDLGKYKITHLFTSILIKILTNLNKDLKSSARISVT